MLTIPSAIMARPLAGRSVVPALSARTMGQFRVVFGTLLFLVAFADPPRTQPAALHRTYSWIADWEWVHALAASGPACSVLQGVTLAALACFAIGFFTRTVYAVAVAGLFVSRLVDLQSRGTHDWDLPLVTLAALTIVPWGDGFSIDRRLARRSLPSAAAGTPYGLAIWIPGLTLGLALAAAAYAKLTNGGLAWITTGAVRYHFVEDAANAASGWGLWVASQPLAAVLFSCGAVAVEAAFIGHVFVRSAWVRSAFGLAGMSLFAGLYAFQGVLWWPWIVLFTALLPWALLDRGGAATDVRVTLRPRHVAAIAILVGQQLVASLTATEIEPLISDYSMYSGTYENPAAFERARYRKMQQLVFSAGSADITGRLEQIDHAPENLLDAAEQLAAGTELDDDLRRALQGIRAEYRSRFGADLTSLSVSADRVLFDWERGTFKPPVRIRIGDVTMPAGDDRE